MLAIALIGGIIYCVMRKRTNDLVIQLKQVQDKRDGIDISKPRLSHMKMDEDSSELEMKGP